MFVRRLGLRHYYLKEEVNCFSHCSSLLSAEEGGEGSPPRFRPINRHSNFLNCVSVCGSNEIDQYQKRRSSVRSLISNYCKSPKKWFKKCLQALSISCSYLHFGGGEGVVAHTLSKLNYYHLSSLQNMPVVCQKCVCVCALWKATIFLNKVLGETRRYFSWVIECLCLFSSL